MARYIQRRILISIPILVAITAIIFTLLQLTPGDPLDAYLTPDQVLSQEQRDSLRHQLGLDRPAPIRYFYWLREVGKGDLGRRIKDGQPVAIVIRQRIGPTLMLMGSGLAIGIALAGFFGGWVDGLIMRFTDVVMTFPPIIIILTVVALTGPGIVKTLLIIGLLNWPVPCRLVRAKFLSLREQEFLVAARAMGASAARMIGVHAFPNTVDVLVVYASFGVVNAILLEAGLSFLGLGVQPPTASWGNMINVARNLQVLEQQPWQWVPAGIAIVLTVLACNFMGDGLRDALDPHMKIG
jgi:peptide/nickel transport system permease protein